MNSFLIRNGLPALLLLIIAVGCEQSFDPFQSQDRFHFSIYGVLDASADTNWVRVMPVRETLYLADDKPADAVVTLENLETGSVITMKDSLFKYGNEAYVWNFWTADKILPDTRYRLSAQRSDGATSSAVVTLPEDFPPPEVIQLSNEDPISVHVNGVGTLVDLQISYMFRSIRTGELIARPESQLHNVYKVEDGFIVELDYTGGIPGFIGSLNPNHMRYSAGDEVVAVSAGTWPEELYSYPDRIWGKFGEQFGPRTPDEELLRTLNELTNVEQGMGYLGAVITHSSSLQICWEDMHTPIECPE